MTRRRSEGNGSSKVNVNFEQLAPDWVRFFSQKPVADPEQFHLYLTRAISDWLKDNPGFRIRCCLGMVSDGNTVAVNMWFDQ